MRVSTAEPPYPWTLTGQWTRRWQAGVARDVAALELDTAALEPRTATLAGKGRRLLRAGPPGEGAAQRWRDRFLSWLDGHDLLICPATGAGPSGPVRVGRPGAEHRLLATAARLEHRPVDM